MNLDNVNVTSNDLKVTSNHLRTNTKPNKKNESILEAGSMQENMEVNKHSLDEILDNNNI